MRHLAFTTTLLVIVSASSALAQESSRRDFEEFCQAWQGRFVGEVTWMTDWPGLGKRGEKVTAYWEGRLSEDGNVMLGKFFGGNGSDTSMIFFDAGAKQIKWHTVSSGGSVSYAIMYKKDGKWCQTYIGSGPDGEKLEIQSNVAITENGNTHTWTGTGTVGGKKMDNQYDVWRRVSNK